MPSERSLEASYFEGMFRANPDPWDFETSDYEKRKCDHSLEALGNLHFAHIFEVGCANGVFTRRLAARCGYLLAVDVSATALELAQRRCADLSHVEFGLMTFPAQAPLPSGFDLVVLSEVAYYWDDDDLKQAANWIKSLDPGALVLLVHWTGETDYPQGGDEAVEKIAADLGPAIRAERSDRMPSYRLDLWRIA